MSIEAMKLALEKLEICWDSCDAIDALKAAIEEAEKKEPMAITITGKLGNIYSFTGDYSLRKGDKVYTTPPAREWQGLTKDDYQAAWDAMYDYEDYDTFGAVIEAKLRSKNT